MSGLMIYAKIYIKCLYVQVKMYNFAANMV